VTLDIRSITDSEIDAFRDCLMSTFGSDSDDDPGGGDRVRALVAPGRAWAAFDAGTMVATAASYALTVGVPGGTLAMAGLSMVTVRPTHRRRGVLRELIRLHLDDARGRGEPLSGLWATEATIYGRFGYGIAAEADTLEADTRGMAFTAGRHVRDDAVCEWVDEAAARERLPAIYARAIADRPGTLGRSDAWWSERHFLNVPLMRGKASRRRYVIARRAGEAIGYVVYRQRPGFQAGTPSGTTEILELIAADPHAEASLWRFIAGIDLFPKAYWEHAPIDTILPWVVADPRRVVRRRTDALWLRVDDVAATLAARRYQVDGELRLAISDTTWQLVVSGGRAHCAQVDAEPELQLAPTALGSVVLGGVSLPLLARAGHISGAADTVARANRLFAWPIAPWCPELF
jgi:predicted acetyltransferase